MKKSITGKSKSKRSTRTIKFKPEFEAKLKELKIKTKFINNLKTLPMWLGNSVILKDKVSELNDEFSWSNFINAAFEWSATPQGREFWSKVYDL